METFSLSGITATTIIDTRRAKTAQDVEGEKPQDDRYPVKYRVTYMRKQVYYSSGIDLTVKEWEILPVTRKPYLMEQRKLIQAGFDKIKKIIKELDHGEGFTLDRLNTRLSRGMKNSILTAFYERIETLKKSGRIGSSIMYGCTVKSIEKYTAKDLKYGDITSDWLQSYEDYLLSLKRSYATIGMYMRTLRAIVNEGKKEGIITEAQYGFREYEIPTGEGRKMALTLQQVGEVMKYPLVNDIDRQCRDFWYFSYLCNGANIADVLKLRYSNIQNDEITFMRQKTIRTNKKKRYISAPLLKPMKEIIERWGNDRTINDLIFPILTEGLTPADEKKVVQNFTRMINERMGKIGKALNYGNISTYTARHSFATVLKRSGANISFISESLGHNDVKTTENYLDSFEAEERKKNANLLIPE